MTMIEKLCANGHVIGSIEDRCGRCGGSAINQDNNNKMEDTNNEVVGTDPVEEANVPTEETAKEEVAPATDEVATESAPAEETVASEAPAEGSEPVA